MALNYVTLILDGFDGSGTQLTRGTATFTPSVQLTDPTDQEWIPPAPVSAEWRKGLAAPQVTLLATDNANVLPAGWGWKASFLNVPGSPAPFTFFLPFTGGATQRLSALVPVSSVTAMGASAVPGVYVTPSGDATGVTDTALIQGLENLGAKTIYFGPGTIWTTGLIKQSGTIWQLAGRNLSTIKLANGANADVIQGAGFATLTLGGQPAGINGWGIRDCTIDGNKANQSGTSYGIRVYGYDFDLTHVTIQNCLSWGLYTEWGGSTVGPGPDFTEEAHYYDIKIRSCGQGGWRDRGPHDSHSYDVIISGNGAGFPGYWGETCGAGICTVAAGSNGVSVSTFAGAGTLSVNSTMGFPSASISGTQGSLTVATSGGTAVITYTGTTATTFTGCTTLSGSGTLSTGGAVTPAAQYSPNGTIHQGMHCYGANANWQYILDGQVKLADCVFEVAQTGMCLMRYVGSHIDGGSLFVAGPQTGCGVQLGDSVNGAQQMRVRASISNLANTSAGTASVVIGNDLTGNDVDVMVWANGSPTTCWTGTNAAGSRYRIRVAGQSGTVNNALSLFTDGGLTLWTIPAATSQAYRIASPTQDLENFNTVASPPRRDYPNGQTFRYYTDNYTTPFLDLDATKAHIVPRSGVAASLAPAVSNGTFATGTPTLNANASDTAGIITATLTASPGAGSIVTLTYKNGFANHPVILLTPANAAAAQMQVSVGTFNTAFTISTAVTPPAAVNGAVVSWFYVVLGQDG